jgi:hypothetical protein
MPTDDRPVTAKSLVPPAEEIERRLRELCAEVRALKKLLKIAKEAKAK